MPYSFLCTRIPVEKVALTIFEQVAVVHAVQDAVQRPSVLVVCHPPPVVALSRRVVQSLERYSDLIEL